MENLGIDYKLIIAQIINFGLFYLVISRFVAKPFMKALEKQKEDESLRETVAKELRNRQDHLEEENKKLAKERKKILDEAIEQGKKQAESVRQEIVATAKHQSEELMTKTKAHLEEEHEKLLKEMGEQVAKVSMVVIEKAFEDYLTPEAKKKITQQAISHIPDGTKLE